MSSCWERNLINETESLTCVKCTKLVIFIFVFIFFLTGLSWRVLQVLWRFRWNNSRCDVSHPSGKCFSFFSLVDSFVGLSVMFKLVIFQGWNWIQQTHVHKLCLFSNNNNNGVANFHHLQQMAECKSILCCCFSPCLIAPCPHPDQ